MSQLTLATVGFERYANATQRAAFLAEMERVGAVRSDGASLSEAGKNAYRLLVICALANLFIARRHLLCCDGA